MFSAPINQFLDRKPRPGQGRSRVDPANTTLAMSCTPSPGCSTPGTSSTGVTSYVYTYAYLITVIGQSSSAEQNTIRETGNLVETVLLNPTSSTKTNFAYYGTFFDQYAICSSAFVSGTMSGPFFSNGSWNFGDAGIKVGSAKYHYTGSVGAVSSKVGYMYSSGTCGPIDQHFRQPCRYDNQPDFSGGTQPGPECDSAAHRCFQPGIRRSERQWSLLWNMRYTNASADVCFDDCRGCFVASHGDAADDRCLPAIQQNRCSRLLNSTVLHRWWNYGPRQCQPNYDGRCHSRR